MSTITIDDSDPSISWNGNWEKEGNPQTPAFDHITTGSKKAGETALLTFTGTSITVYGTLTHGSNTSKVPLSLYTIDEDGSLSGTFAPSRPLTDLYRQQFFSSPSLPYGTHKLVVTDMTTTDLGLWLDYFVVTTGVGANTTSSPSAQGSPQPTESTAITTTKAHSNSWIIAVSLVVGGCTILAALMLAVYVARRRRLKRREVRTTQITEPFPVQQSIQGRALSPESPYVFSGIHRKAGFTALLAPSAVQTSYVHDSGSGSQISDLAAQPPTYTEG